MALNSKQVRKKYNRYSFFYNIVEWPMETLLFKKWRRKLLKDVKGKVLEIGVGTGKNLAHYDYNKVKPTAVDLSEGMLAKARHLAQKNSYPVLLRQADAEDLPFEDNSFDYVICTFLLCSVADPIKVLGEMKRVCKKKGKILMLEHVLSKNKLIAFLEHLHNPITRFLLGFNVNRDTVKNIRDSGLNIVKEENLALKAIFKQLEVRKG